MVRVEITTPVYSSRYNVRPFDLRLDGDVMYISDVDQELSINLKEWEWHTSGEEEYLFVRGDTEIYIGLTSEY